MSIGQQSGWNVIHDRCSSAFNVFVFGFENGQTTAPKMGVEICHRTGAIGRDLPSTRVIDGQVRCIRPEVKPQNLQVIWNVQFIKGVQSVRPTWFEDTTPKNTTSQQSQDPHKKQAQPLHGLKLVIKEEVLPATDQPQFQSLELLASRGLLAPDTWKCKRAQVSLKATIDVPCRVNHRANWRWALGRLPHASRMTTPHRWRCQTMLHSQNC